MNQVSKELTSISDNSQKIHLKYEDIIIPTSAYNYIHNHHSRRHPIEQPESKIDPAIKINCPPKYFRLDSPNNHRLDKPDINGCPRLYKPCHGKDVTCISDLKKHQACEEYQRYLAKHPKRNNHNHNNHQENNSGLEDKTIQ